jgi:molecular chaperone HtpG
MKADLKLNKSDDEKKKDEEQKGELKPLLDRIQEVLKDHVREVRASDRLTDSPCCLVVPEGGTHAFMERLLKHRGSHLPHVKRILEVNPTHPLIGSLSLLHAKDPSSATVREWVEMLYDQALLTEGGLPDDPNRFAARMTALMSQAATQAVSAQAQPS